MSSDVSKSASGFRTFLSVALIWVSLFFVYGSLVDHQFQPFDDGLYVQDNSYVQDGLTWEGIQWAFANVDVANWHPLTWLSHMADINLFGPKPAGHFAMNLVYQGLAAMALLYFLRRTPIGYWPALVVTLIWAIHPTNVESVAWIGQRKTLVCGSFFFLSLAFYLRWQKERVFRLYGYSVICAILALMAKPSAVVIPLLLLALDVWPGHRVVWDNFAPGRFRQAFKQLTHLVWEKAVFFFVSGLASAVTFYAQHDIGATAMSSRIPLGTRLLNCLEALWDYLGKSVGSAETSLMYALREPDAIWVAAGAVMVVTLLALGWQLRRSSPWVLATVVIFFASFLPVIGIVQVGMQRLADRYIYFPLIGMIMLIVMFAVTLSRRGPAYARLSYGVLAAWFGVLVLQAKGHVALWGDSSALFRNAEVVGGSSYAMRLNQGVVLQARQEFVEARRIYMTLRDEGATINTAMIDLAENKVDDGIMRLRRLLSNKKYQLGASYTLGMALANRGDYEDAKRAFLSCQRELPVRRTYQKRVEDIRKLVPVMLSNVEQKIREKAAATASAAKPSSLRDTGGERLALHEN